MKTSNSKLETCMLYDIGRKRSFDSRDQRLNFTSVIKLLKQTSFVINILGIARKDRQVYVAGGAGPVCLTNLWT